MFVLALVIALLAPVGRAAAAGADEDRDLLLDGVVRIAAPGAPGDLSLVGEEAFIVATGDVAGAPAAVVGATRSGRGRVVAFAHGGYLGAEALGIADTGRLMLNAVTWAGGDVRNRPLRVVAPRAVAELLASRGGDRFEVVDPAGRVRPDVIVLDAHRLRDEEMLRLRAHVRNGGGLVVAGLGWGWQQLNPERSLRNDFPGNKLLGPMGIVFGGEVARTTDGDGYRAARADHEMVNAPAAAAHLVKLVQAPEPVKKQETPAIDPGVKLASATLVRAVRSLPPGDEWLDRHVRPLRRLYEKRFDEAPLPAPGRPLGSDDIRGLLGRILLSAEMDELAALPPQRVRAHQSAASFPGVAKISPTPLQLDYELETGQFGWQSTGLYVPPGELVHVRVPAGAPAGLRVRIGAHSDSLWHHDKWQRAPQISVELPLGNDDTRIASPFGGPLYIVVPESAVMDQSVQIDIRGRFWQMPRYVAGKTSDAEWRETIRGYPAPWAEIDAGPVIVTIPSEHVRGLGAPSEVTAAWKAVADACAELAGIPSERRRPERFVADVQISNGYMHAGYPIMTHLDAAPKMADARHLTTEGNWGLFHEIGHNHQVRDWTPSGTGEVTNNVFTLYCYEKVTANKRPNNALFGEERARRIREYLSAGAPFEVWKQDPFLALISYVQLQEAFGWEAYIDVFAEYRDLPHDQRPADDQARWDQWVTRFSRRVGHNLVPFYKAWGIPVSEETRRELAGLPAWMPEDWPGK